MGRYQKATQYQFIRNLFNFCALTAVGLGTTDSSYEHRDFFAPDHVLAVVEDAVTTTRKLHRRWLQGTIGTLLAAALGCKVES